MSFFRSLSAVSLVGLMSFGAATPGGAYTLDQAAQPRELPPAGYSGLTYVDSRGCAYVRGSVGGSATWVARLSGDRKTVVCGLTPTFANARPVNVAPPAPLTPPAPSAVAPVATAAVTNAPRPGAMPAPTAFAAVAPAAPVAPAASAPLRSMTVTCPAPGTTARVRVGGDTVSITCSASQTRPATMMVRHPNGDTTRLIVNPPATAVAAAPMPSLPSLPATGGSVSPQVRIGGTAPGGASNGFGNGYGVLSGPAYPPMDPVPSAGSTALTGGRTIPTSQLSAIPARPLVPSQVAPPAGYREAWSDGRLNPNRGPRTALGDAQMAGVFDTTRVPMREVAPRPAAGLIVTPTGDSDWMLSSKTPAASAVSVPAPIATGGYRYVQVGMFNVPGNAEAAAARLRALGLPGKVAQTASGRTVVVAGPYADAAALQNALNLARRNGFGDAFLRS